MACFNPILAVDYGVMSDGKHMVKIFGRHKGNNGTLEAFRKKFGSKLMMLPCGHCVACAQDYARMWQSRIMAEAMYYEKKCFLTLTYRDAPEAPSKDDLRQFIKKLRNRFGNGIKFFGCGEKGSHTGRSHYHLILFGVDFSDDRYVIAKRGENYVYRSPLLEDLWTHGFSSIGSLEVESAGYVAQYCNKKKIENKSSGEFVIMSRGLGRQYFEDHNVFDSDYLYFDGNKFKIPRYFLKLASKADFYTQVLGQDYQDRKKEVALNFRYDKSRSFVFEDEAMKVSSDIQISKMKHEKGEVRDVL